MNSRNARTSLALAASLMLAACGINPSRPSPEQVASADYGSVPTNYEAIIRKYFAETLKDPDSVQYREFSKPEKTVVTNKAAFSGIFTFRYGWNVDANVNAKNSYGGYTGFQTWGFTFRGDEIIFIQNPK